MTITLSVLPFDIFLFTLHVRTKQKTFCLNTGCLLLSAPSLVPMSMTLKPYVFGRCEEWREPGFSPEKSARIASWNRSGKLATGSAMSRPLLQSRMQQEYRNVSVLLPNREQLSVTIGVSCLKVSFWAFSASFIDVCCVVTTRADSDKTELNFHCTYESTILVHWSKNY